MNRMDDVISRQDAIDVLKRNYPSSCFEDLCKAVDIAIKALSEQHCEYWDSESNYCALNRPSAQPRKKGKWIEFDSDEDKYDLIKCSCCEHIFTVDSFHWSDRGFVKDDFNFCPICGASTKGESE